MKTQNPHATHAPSARSYSARRTITHILLAAVLVAISALVYRNATAGGWLAELDHQLLEHSYNDRSNTLAKWVTWYTNIGTTAFTAPIATALVVWLAGAKRSWWPIVITALSATCSVLTTTLVKEWLGRPRPEHTFAVAPFEYAPSFPSGHTLNAVVVFGIIAILYASTLGYILAGIYILLMGASRIWLGHHWFTDVLAGWLIGAAWLLVISAIFWPILRNIRATRHTR